MTPATGLPPSSLKLAPGDRIRVTQHIVGRDIDWSSAVDGVVEACRAEPTGSWFAHGKADRLWLQRVRLRKDDGEITTLVIDPGSVVERVPRPAN